MQRGEGADGRDLEDGADAALVGRAVEVAIARLDEPGNGEAAVGAAVEGMQRGQGAGPVQVDDGAAARGAAARGRAVEVAIARLDEPRSGLAAFGGAVEGMQRGEGAGPVQLEDGAD